MATNINRLSQPNYVDSIPQQKYIKSDNSGWSAVSFSRFLFAMIIWFMIIQFVIYKINKYRKNKVINDWWNNRGGKNYNTCFQVK